MRRTRISYYTLGDIMAIYAVAIAFVGLFAASKGSFRLMFASAVCCSAASLMKFVWRRQTRRAGLAAVATASAQEAEQERRGLHKTTVR
jgi:hypothetical protein